MNSQKIHKKLMRNGREGRHLEAASFDLKGSSLRARGLPNHDGNQYGSSGRFLAASIAATQGQSEELEDSGSHLYESLERLNENRREQKQKLELELELEQEAGCLNKQQIKATSRLSALKNNDHSNSGSSKDNSARSRLKMGRSIDFLVSRKSSRMSALVCQRGQGKDYNGDDRVDVDEDEDDGEDDDWWQRSTYNMREQQQQVVSSRETRQEHSSNGACELAVNWSSGVQTNRMEPVSIEAFNEEFVSVVDDDFGNDNDIPVHRKGGRSSDEGTCSIEACSEISSSYQSSSGLVCYTCSSIK